MDVLYGLGAGKGIADPSDVCGGNPGWLFSIPCRPGRVWADEIEIQPDYQRTILFYRFLHFLAGVIPGEVNRIGAYINKRNANSQRIAEKLGMKIAGENKSGRGWYYQGGLHSLKRFI